jgi:hypothetical protein
MLNDDQVKARTCLATGSWLIDPKYQHPPAVYEEKLKERCRVCWKLREFFPEWVTAYMTKWAKDKQPVVTREEEDFA